MISVRKVVLSGLAIALCSCAAAPVAPQRAAAGDYSAAIAEVTRLIAERMDEIDIAGLSIALVDDQKVVWAQGFGMADRGKGIPSEPETLFMAGSVSKLFTSTAVMQLHEKGKLDIDKPLLNYLPKFRIRTRFLDAGPVTIRQMLTHRSGLPTDHVKGEFSTSPAPLNTLLAEIAEDHAAFPPGYMWSYSNLAMSLLGLMVASVSEKDFAESVEQAILRPAGMADSSFVLSDAVKARLSKAYKDGAEKDEVPIRDTPAGGLYTNVLDLARFSSVVFAGGKSGDRRIIGSKTLEEMLKVQNEGAPLDFDLKMGLGWIRRPVRGLEHAGRVAWHNGATLCHRASLVILPDHKLGAVVLANTASAARAADEIAAAALRLMLEARTGDAPPRQKETESARAGFTKAALAGFEGRYETAAGLATVRARGGYLEIELGGKTLRAYPKKDGTFRLEYRLLGLIPLGIADLERMRMSFETALGRDLIVGTRDGLRSLFGSRVKHREVPAAWAARAGAYGILNKGDDAVFPDNVRLEVEDGLLIIGFSIPAISKEPIKISLDPISESEAIVQGLGRGKGETLSVVTIEGQDVLQYSGFRFARAGE
ncbi:MAG: beta-lactamase family protein [Deltaproteobacteria bacterium]|nr:beta-lactamase family protein [Deltaproteobacteria bacterium]